MTEVRALNRDAAKHQPECVFERWRLSVFGEINASNEGMATRGYAREQLKVLEAIEEAKVRLKERLESEMPNLRRRA